MLVDIITTINGRRMHTLEDTTLGREKVREFGIVRRATPIASVMIDDATNGGAPLVDADESPTIVQDGNCNGVGNNGAGTSAWGGGALGWQQKAGPITQKKTVLRQLQRMRMMGNNDDDITISHEIKRHKDDEGWQSQGNQLVRLQMQQ